MMAFFQCQLCITDSSSQLSTSSTEFTCCSLPLAHPFQNTVSSSFASVSRITKYIFQMGLILVLYSHHLLRLLKNYQSWSPAQSLLASENLVWNILLPLTVIGNNKHHSLCHYCKLHFRFPRSLFSIVATNLDNHWLFMI